MVPHTNLISYSTGFGIGVASGSVYLDDLSMAILEMEDHGYISQIEDEYVFNIDTII